MKKQLIYSLLVAAVGISYAHAEEQNTSGETKVKLEEAKPDKAEQGDVDEVITNRKLRAEVGSKSKYSFSASLSYSGGSVEKPLDRVRPNIRQSTVTPTLAAVGGSVGAKYRVNPTDSMSLSTGVRMFTPFHDGVQQKVKTPSGREIEQSDISDISLGYGTAYKAMGIQNVTDVSVTYVTNEFSRDAGQVASVDLGQTMIYDIGETGLSVGVTAGIGNTFYDQFNAAIKTQTSDYYVGAYPFLEYVLNDTLNLRTISGLWVYEHIRSEDAMTFSKNKIYQSVGLGISVTRDIYLYPNVQFLPEDNRADATNVALSATINL